MQPLRRLSAIELVANHLREELFRRTWRRLLPGINALAVELGANHKTVEAAVRLLEKERLLVPQDVSLVCTDYDRFFAWSQPSVAHIGWDSRPVVRRIVRWANNVARGLPDVRQSWTPAKFVEGGTIGPAKGL